MPSLLLCSAQPCPLYMHTTTQRLVLQHISPSIMYVALLHVGVRTRAIHGV
jgi:hypothetical protein